MRGFTTILIVDFSTHEFNKKIGARISRVAGPGFCMGGSALQILTAIF